MDRTYKFGSCCWRFEHGHIHPDEKHPCFFCGYSISVREDDCSTCGIMPCPNCKNCLCTINDIKYLTVIAIHHLYCKKLDTFAGKIDLPEGFDKDVIRCCEHAIKHCYAVEGLGYND